jgi:thiol-disulfide isomerase/thioredoxin
MKSSTRTVVRQAALVVAAVVAASHSLGAQTATSPAGGRVATPGERARGMRLYQNAGMVSDDGRQRISNEHIDDAVEQRAQQWVVSLQTNPVRGLQLDPMGEVAVAAGQDALAQRQFAARLATPGLSVDDRGYTLLLAINAFGAKASNSARMNTALGYLRQLDALPARVVTNQFRARVRIAEAYYDAGDGARVIVHLTHAFSLVPTMSFERRNWLEFRRAFLILADVWSGQPNGRQQIDSMTTWLHPYTNASPALVAKDSSYYWTSRYAEREYRLLVQMTSFLGRPAPSITAHYWVNTVRPVSSDSVFGAVTKSLDDGKIRIMEYGHYGCAGCRLALPKMERIRKRMPNNVEVWFVADEGDLWGATRCTPDEMAKHLTRYYVDRKGYGLPIALWMGPREADPDGGSLIRESPMSAAYQFVGVPTFIVTDGQGLVRHIQFGFSEPILMRSVQYLLAEAERSRVSLAK